MTNYEIQIRKDGSTWSADVHWADGKKWLSWLYNFRTKGALEREIQTITRFAKRAAS